LRGANCRGCAQARRIQRRVSGADTEIDAGNADTICVCFLEEVSEARLSFTVRKFARRVPSAEIIVAGWEISSKPTRSNRVMRVRRARLRLLSPQQPKKRQCQDASGTLGDVHEFRLSTSQGILGHATDRSGIAIGSQLT
jgi:hypothetical protein